MKNTSTESVSLHDDLEKKSTAQLLRGINEEDHKVALALKESIPHIEKFVEAVWPKMKEGGRLFYIGAGTSGRLGIVDASELPPTFGASPNMVIGLIAGGDTAIRKAVEHAEDNPKQAWKDLQEHRISPDDSVLGIAASGSTPYVVGGIKAARKAGCTTGCITCNTSSALAKAAEIPIEIITGPEYVTGSTRMKAGSAQKMALNMLSTALMIKLGKVQGNRMVDMQLSNNKLVERGIRMICDDVPITKEEAKVALEQYGSVREALAHLPKGRTKL